MSKVSWLEDSLRNAEDPALATCCGNLKRGAKGFGSSARSTLTKCAKSLENLGRLKPLCCSHECCPLLQYTLLSGMCLRDPRVGNRFHRQGQNRTRNFSKYKSKVNVEEVALWSDLQVVKVTISNAKNLSKFGSRA